MNKRVIDKIIFFLESVKQTQDFWAKSGVDSRFTEELDKYVKDCGGVDMMLVRVAQYITRPDNDDEQYPTINFTENGVTE
jgi:hypothetical protein